jgi:hypothetical protein
MMPAPPSRLPCRGLTIVEILIVAACLSLILVPVVHVLRAGSKASLKGMVRIETTLEGRRVLQQLRADLKQACFASPNDRPVVFTFDDLLQRSGSPPTFRYEWLAFPKGGDLAESFRDATNGKALRLVSRVTYLVEGGPPAIAPFFQLVREERFHPDHPQAALFPGGVQRRVLSSRVNYLDIKPHLVDHGGVTGLFWWVTLQLGDLAGVPAARRNDPSQWAPSELVLADFFDLVSPEFFRAMMRDPRANPNWHAVISAP